MSLTLSGSGTIGGLVAGGLPDATITSAELASNAVNSQTLTLLNASGSAPVYACRAWVNFDGTGTVAIRASGNVSSITDLGTGFYQVNMATAMPDSSYSVNVTRARADANGGALVNSGAVNQANVQVRTMISTIAGSEDANFVFVAIFR